MDARYPHESTFSPAWLWLQKAASTRSWRPAKGNHPRLERQECLYGMQTGRELLGKGCLIFVKKHDGAHLFAFHAESPTKTFSTTLTHLYIMPPSASGNATFAE